MLKMDNSELTSKFHLIAGSYISLKIASEYLFLLKECYSHKIRGDTTKINRIIETESKANRLINIFAGELTSIGCDLNITESEIEGLETILYEVVTLEPIEQQTVLNLINELKNARLSRDAISEVE